MNSNDVEVIQATKASEIKERRTRLLKTLLIILSFMGGLGLGDAIRGPTLLDLTDIYETSVDTISFMFMTYFIGNMLGSFFAGYILDKHPHHNNLIMCVFHLIYSILIALVPFTGHLPLLFSLFFAIGCSCAGIETGGNVLCLEIWRGLDGGPAMHAIHFSASLGAVMAPLLAAPFLSTRIVHLESGNETNHTELFIKDPQDTKVPILYPIIGSITLLISLGFLYFEIDSARDRRESKRLAKEQDKPTQEKEEPKQTWTKSVILVVFLMATFFFLYAGIDHTLGIYIPTFAVECRLKLTKVQGANLVAIFWAAFALIRFLAIFAAMTLRPVIIMGVSLVLCILGSFGLMFWAESSELLLQSGVAVLGAGMASVYATGLLWLEQYVVMTSKLGALFVVAGNVGPNVMPVLVGQFITEWPMFLLYLAAATMVVCVAVFVLALYIGRKIKVVRNKKEKEEEGEEMVAMTSKKI